MAASSITTRTPWFRARNPFAPSRPTGISHLPGGSAGGPVYIPKVYDGRNRTFVFGSFETFQGQRDDAGVQPDRPAEGVALRRFLRTDDSCARPDSRASLSRATAFPPTV